MDHHLEWQIRLSTESPHGNLYSWFLHEVGETAGKLTRRYIPYAGYVGFTLTKIRLKSTTGPDLDGGSFRDYTSIEAELVPVAKLNGERVRLSMFGTSRSMPEVGLSIGVGSPGHQLERCNAWGHVSYTGEIDFRAYTSDDCLGFTAFVSPERLAQYATWIREGSITGGALNLTGVPGFFAEWSPGSVDTIKVLTADKKVHAVELPRDCKIEPPRLGEVNECELIFFKEMRFALPVKHESEDTAPAVMQAVPADHAPKVTEASSTSSSPQWLKIAIWTIAVLLFLILVKLR